MIGMTLSWRICMVRWWWWWWWWWWCLVVYEYTYYSLNIPSHLTFFFYISTHIYTFIVPANSPSHHTLASYPLILLTTLLTLSSHHSHPQHDRCFLTIPMQTMMVAAIWPSSKAFVISWRAMPEWPRRKAFLRPDMYPSSPVAVPMMLPELLMLLVLVRLLRAIWKGCVRWVHSHSHQPSHQPWHWHQPLP